MADDFAALCADRAEFGWQPTVDAWLSSWDEGFSARLGDAGFLSLTIPRDYGGQGRSHLHRYVVTEELLAAGAPVADHAGPQLDRRVRGHRGGDPWDFVVGCY